MEITMPNQGWINHEKGYRFSPKVGEKFEELKRNMDTKTACQELVKKHITLILTEEEYKRVDETLRSRPT